MTVTVSCPRDILSNCFDKPLMQQPSERKKMYKRMIVLLFVVVSSAMLRNAVLADFNAGQFAENFNSFVIPSGQSRTPLFYMGGSGPVFNITDVSDYGFNLNIGAYSPNTAGILDPVSYAHDGPHIPVGNFYSHNGGEWLLLNDDLYFSSFALGTTSWLPYECVGTLDYHNGTTRTSDHTAINLGIAYLYAKYATESLPGYDHANHSTAAELSAALQLLLSGNITAEQWENNSFLGHLIREAGEEVWLRQYNLNDNYDPWLDNYAVYVLNLSQFIIDWSGGGSEPEMRWDAVADVLYLVQRGNDVPEPATLISWAVIGLGLFGAARHRKRRHTGTLP